MALGRSASLSLNTNAANNLFASQNQSSNPPPAAGGLFGNSANPATSQPSQTAPLFGAAQNTQPQQGGGLFGTAPASQPTQAGGLFGNTGATSQPQQSQPLFGAPLGQQQPQQSSGTGLFGNSTNRPNLFGASTNNNATNPAPLFGGSLFGGGNTQQNQQQQQQPVTQNTFMGLTATAPGSNQPVSMLGASQYRGTQMPSFSGRLTLGQNNANASSTTGAAGAQPSGGTGAVQVNYDTMKSTTRFADLIPDVAQALERIDGMIQAQEKFCREIEALIPKHGQDVTTLKPDVELVTEKTDAVETALALDAQGVQTEKGVLQQDIATGERLQRVVDNLRQPPQYHTRGDDAASKNLDLIGHFFRPLAADMERTLSIHANAIAEVEAHMAILEQTAAMSRPGGGKGSGIGNVQELAETLGAFEQGILGAAGMVGQCREGVNELVLGRGFGGR